MMYSEFNSKVEKLSKSKNYWLKNNLLNFIDEILKLKGVSNYQKHKLLDLKSKVLLVEDGSHKKKLTIEQECLLKQYILEIKKIF